MPGPLLLLLAILLSFVIVFFVLPFLRFLIRQRTSPLRHLPGPPCTSLLIGNLGEMHDQENNNLIHTWEASYGPTFVYRGFLAAPRLMTMDPLALAHILGHAYEYPKPEFVRDSLAGMAAGHDGLLTVEGDQHRRQRRILGPAFSKLHLASLTPVFWDKATQLRDIWLEQADAQKIAPSRVDVLSWLGRATLDVIGEAGFGYRFDALSSTSAHNELATAFGIIFSTARKLRMITILQAWFPILRRFRRNGATMVQAHATMDRIGMQLIDQKRSEILAEAAQKGVDTSRAGRDLLSLLIRSNLSTPVPVPSSPSNRAALSSLTPHNAQHPGPARPRIQMSTREVLCQISTFIAAGHETTASALTWCLYALARAPHVQTKLRAALHAIPVPPRVRTKPSQAQAGDSEGHSEGDQNQEEDLATGVQACTYLDWVVRETLRLHSPVTSTMRVCARPGGDEIPVSVPVAVRRSGFALGAGHDAAAEDENAYGAPEESRWSVRVAEGDILTIPIQAVNRCVRLWGEDAGDFRPERWADPPPEARSIPGLLSGTLTFLNGNGSVAEGNRACIGWRFALIEIKIFLYTLVKDLEFWIDDDMVIEKRIK
ncbi:putative cytochrome P450 [Lyophyllum shimeji]|uniref:Cytochrome P450 n=1 Tax=Lyophyllum shimeji TaxID=47721 RepID=A0A9P3UPH3_LYOSH|nr:putative cytochrome P450 [Lyophyllum shimeji]